MGSSLRTISPAQNFSGSRLPGVYQSGGNSQRNIGAWQPPTPTPTPMPVQHAPVQHAPVQHIQAINQPIPLPGYHPPMQTPMPTPIHNPIAGGPVAYPGGNNGQVPGLPGGPIMNPLQGPMPIGGAMSGANNMIDPTTGLPFGAGLMQPGGGGGIASMLPPGSGSMFAMPGGNPGGPIGGPVGMNPIPAQR
jgi:hypothetical protein